MTGSPQIRGGTAGGIEICASADGDSFKGYRGDLVWCVPVNQAKTRFADPVWIEIQFFDLATPDRSTYRQAALISHPTLRSLDALHIAAALDLNADEIISYDKRMIDACTSLGISTVTPR